MRHNRIDVYTHDEVNHAKRILNELKGAPANDRLQAEVVTEEVMTRINQETGQENVRAYIAYRLQFIAEQH